MAQTRRWLGGWALCCVASVGCSDAGSSADVIGAGNDIPMFDAGTGDTASGPGPGDGTDEGDAGTTGIDGTDAAGTTDDAVMATDTAGSGEDADAAVAPDIAQDIAIDDAIDDAGSDAAAADAASEVSDDISGEVDGDAASDGTSDAADDMDGDMASDGDGDGDGGSDATPDIANEVAGDGTGDGAATDATATDADAAPQPTKFVGCSDGSREGFLDTASYPLVAACAGAWDVPGIHHGTPACGRHGGNDGSNAAGKGCNVEDLCAEGWHVCYGAKDLKERNAKGCDDILAGGAKSPAFFLARTSSTGAFNCSQDATQFGAPGTSNDLFGCGDLGCGIAFATYPSCDPLHRASHDLCKGLRNDGGAGDWCNHLGKFPGESNTWNCGKNTTLEANNVVKSDPKTQGGVLCCTDMLP